MLGEISLDNMRYRRDENIKEMGLWEQFKAQSQEVKEHLTAFIPLATVMLK